MLLTQSQADKAGQLDPEVAELLSKLPKSTKPPGNHIEANRNAAAMYDKKLLERLGPSPPEIDELYHEIDVRDGTKSSLKIHKPSLGPPGPLIILFYSGGFISGSNDQLSDVARAFVKLFGATAVTISYRLSPEHKFPTAQHDAIDSVRWIAETATSSPLSADPAKGFVIGGASSGGNLAAVLSRYFQKEALPHPLTGQWLSVANLMDPESVPPQHKGQYLSREQNAQAPVLNAEGIVAGAMATQEDPRSELRYPLNSTTALSGQPKTYIQACGMDPFRDDSLIYDEMLKEAGVSTKVTFYPGHPHAVWLIVPGSEVAKRALVDVVVGHGWLLGKEVTSEDAAMALQLQ